MDTDGLTVWATPDKARRPGRNARLITINPAALRELEVVQSGDDHDHFAIRPRDPARMNDWMASRERDPERFEDWHPLTREVVAAIIETDLPEDP